MGHLIPNWRAGAALLAAMLGLAGQSAGAQPNWSTVDSPNAHATQHNFINDVACVSVSDCWAVGYLQTGSAYQALIEHWDGRSWSVVASPDTSAAQDDFVQSVSCASSADCWVVGYSWSRAASAYQGLVLRWDGASWSTVASPGETATNTYLIDVTCSSASECWAVGHRQIGLNGGGFGPSQTLIRRWDGFSWAPVTSPNTTPAQANTLTSVTCTAAADCWAVGYSNNGAANQPLTVHWDGMSWGIVPSPSTSAAEQNFLNNIACLSTSDCRAVGVRRASVDQTLVIHWDGSSWTLTPSPNTDAGVPNVLFGVACSSASECWAVGYHKAGNPLQTLVQSWDGGSWSIVASPNSSAGQTNTLRAVTCASPAECWAVGNYYNAQSISRTLTLRYRKEVLDESADPFTLIERPNVATNVYVTSETRTITGYNGSLPISIDNGGQYRINGGAWASATGTIASGSTLAVRHVSASTASTTKTSRVSVGASFADFKSTTSADDRTPNPFTFGTRTGVDPGLVESEVTTVEGFSVGVPIVPGPGLAYRIDGVGAYTAATGTVHPGQSLQVQHTATSQSLGYTKTYVKVGGVTGYFTTRTK